MKTSPLQYPWLSTLLGLLLVLYLYAAADSDVSRFYGIQEALLQTGYKLGAVLLFVLAIIFDIHRFRRNKIHYDRQREKYAQQIEELFKAKNTLQHKAHKYSDHADKLKLFISDRLLEYIEYDEKFLHFKNIASEVRHNGVICYDKVVTALNKAMADSEQGRGDDYQDALDSMRYLWDLLDLSTTDNIAMYIANKLYESEEQYYQQLLAAEGEQAPYTPIYSARGAAIKCLRGLVEQPQQLVVPAEDAGTRLHYQDSRFLLDLDEAGNLLGNENYFVLLAENLINNALYYAGSKKYQNKHSRIAVFLGQEERHCLLRIYNKGPIIGDDIKERIFQLGFSTKRSKDNNGKGLGLYFVQQIVNGYEGQIRFDSITNREDSYVLRIELDNGEKRTEVIHTRLDDKAAILCQEPRCEELFPKVEHNFKSAIKSLEVTVQSSEHTYSFDTFAPEGATVLLDPQHPAYPRWCLEITPQKTQHKLIFKPLDVTGVQFTVTLPSAESRLDADYHERSGKALPDLDALDQDFEEVTQPYS
jgi:signal transduction histidine kinase